MTASNKYENQDNLSARADFAGDNRDQRAYLYWCALWLSECLRIAKPGSVIDLFTDWRQLPVTTDALQIGGWVWRGIVPWNKTESARPQPGRFRAQCEYLIWGSKGEMSLTRPVSPMPGFYTCVVRQDDKHHMAGKPTALITTLIEIFPRDSLILDPFMGSGTTLVAARNTGRRAIGIEVVEQHCQTARERLLQHSLPLIEEGPDG